MKPWLENLIKGAARAITTFATLSWSWGKLKKQWSRISGEVSDQAGRIGSSARDFAVSTGEKIREPLEDLDVRDRVQQAPRTVRRVVSTVTGEPMKKKKTGWSFFKVILALGVIVALGVFLLDKFLPKPYRDEELDEGWPGEAGLDPTDETLSRPLDEEEEKVSGNGGGEADEDEEEESE